MTRKSPLNSNPNVLCAHELMGKGCCKERSDGIAIVTLCVNRVQSQSLFFSQCEHDIEIKSKEKPLAQQP